MSNKFNAIDRELDRLHEMARTTIMGDVTYAEVFERIVKLQDQLIKEQSDANRFEIMAREWAKGCSVATGLQQIHSSGLDYPWDCKECTRGFLEAMYKLAQKKSS